jgi:prolipoprotein diacylglyceryltransferase
MSYYDILNFVSGCSLLAYNLIRFRQHQQIPCGHLRSWAVRRRETGHRGLLSRDLFWVFVNIVLISVVQFMPAPIVNKLFGNLVGTGMNYFGLLLAAPLILPLYCWIMGINIASQIDAVTPAFPLALFFTSLGCSTAGCCNGIPWEFGLRNPYNGRLEFPIQLLEAAVALGIFIFFLKAQKRLKPGIAYPVYVMLYSGIRFFTEFLRAEKNIIWIFKTYHIICLAAFLLAAMGYLLILRHGKKPAKPETEI